MRPLLVSLSVFSFVLNPLYGQNPNQPDPEQVLRVIGQYQLKYKHVLAYVDMETYGEDPAVVSQPNYIQELTQECLSEFQEDQATFLDDMESHYEAMLMDQNNVPLPPEETERQQITEPVQPQIQADGPVAQWKQLLSGSLLYSTTTQSHVDLFVQSTNYLHFCPNGLVHFFLESGGGGGSITAPRQTEFQGSVQWDVVEHQGIPVLKMAMPEGIIAYPLTIINQQINILGLGVMKIQQGGAQCF